MRKPMRTKWGVTVLGLSLVGASTAALAQQPAYDMSSAQDSRLTGTSDGQSTVSLPGMLSPTGTSSASDWDRMTPAQQQGQMMSVQQPMSNMTPSLSGVQSQTGNFSSMTSQVSSAELAAQQEYEIAQLRTQVARLQQQLLQAQTALQQMSSAQNTGVGGSGTAGTGTASNGTSAIGDPNAGASPGATGIGYTSGTGQGGSGAASSGAQQGIAEASVIHTGRVRSVSAQQLVLEDGDGGSFSLPLAQGVRVYKGRQQMALGNLAQGTRVRTSADLYAQGKPVTRIEVLTQKAQKP